MMSFEDIFTYVAGTCSIVGLIIYIVKWLSKGKKQAED